MTKEELEQRLVEKGGELLEWTERAAEFSAEQAPLLVQEILRWGFAKSLTFGCLWLIPAALTLGTMFYCFRKAWKDFARDEFFMFPGLISAFMAILTGGAAISNLMIAAKIYLAPRLYLLEQLRELF